MKNKKLLLMLVLAAFTGVSSMDYADEQVEIAYCKKMKSEGHWPKGYQCD